MDPGSNADLEAGEEELFVTELQTARLRERCRVFAPEYRQVSVAGLVSNPSPDAWSIAYADVVDAFKHYMNHENGGRGVILIGHSQGGMMLTQLMNEEIDDNEALRRQLEGKFMQRATGFGALERPVAELGAEDLRVEVRSQRCRQCVVVCTLAVSRPPQPICPVRRSAQHTICSHL